MFAVQLLESMQIALKYPVTIRVDNKGDIFMASNIMTMSHTKYVDIRYKYVNGKGNRGDILTSNILRDNIFSN